MFNNLLTKYPELVKCKDAISDAKERMIAAFAEGKKLLVCGNGGSCADSDHIVGELMKGFLLRRPVPQEERAKLQELFPQEAEILANNLQGALPAISLNAHSGLISAFANDVAPEMVYAQQVYGYGNEGDLFLGLTTSGNSENVVKAAMIAKAKKMTVIALVGEKDCKLDKIADVVIHAPKSETFQVQELHLPIYHYLCAACEEHFFA
ncbi:MAG: SIS domain-containing protein [Clostridia bacterium]|nr:SIS domain-containing protein [Clostridia bacterium]